jgi:alkylation response protein AidB-like acyl-CoA dehydrogenase
MLRSVAHSIAVAADQGSPPTGPAFEAVLAQLATHASELDASPRFPSESFEHLALAGVTQLAADRDRCDLPQEIALVRAVASADASTARILDGHFNGVERLALLADDDLRTRELGALASGDVLFGVWGADPAPGEGPPARIEQGNDGEPVLRGVKTFCSGAGGVVRALVVARDEHDARRLAYVDPRRGARVDRSWYRASGLRASESHRVEFHDTPIIAILGGEDELLREPWFSRDAIRTAATWAGIADCILAATIEAVGERSLDDVRLHALGRMRVAQGSIDRWLEHTAIAALASSGEIPGSAMMSGTTVGGRAQTTDVREPAIECRIALSDAARTIAAEAARVCGSRALVGGGTLDRARRDLDLFLLQHSLDPKLVQLGARTLEEGTR